MGRLLDIGVVVWIAIVLFFVVIVAPVYTISSYVNKNSYEIKVTEKETKNSKESSKYLIFGIDEEGNEKVFENTDALFARKFNSSDLYAKISVGKTYEFKTIGFRIPFLSKYENIMTVKEAK